MPERDYRRPRGFMTLGTDAGETTIIRVTEVAAVCEGKTVGSRRRGALLTLNSGQQADVVESLSEVAEAMNAEDPERLEQQEGGD